MTLIEKIEMYKSKKLFIENVSKAFEASTSHSNVVKVDYELYVKELAENDVYFAEYLVVTFRGGAKSVRNINGNSNNANFIELGNLINGGYYDEVKIYNELCERGFDFVTLED